MVGVFMIIYSLKQIFRYLRCLLLHFTFKKGMLSLPLECHCTCLQELYIYTVMTILAETFINALYSHGGLEHVVLHVKSLTIRSITSLMEYSPNLVTFEITLCPKSWMEVQLKHLIAHVRTRFYKTKLTNGGLFSVQWNVWRLSFRIPQPRSLDFLTMLYETRSMYVAIAMHD